MPNLFFISDTHFSHKNILGFVREDGSPERPEFSCIEEMNEHIVEMWNKTVNHSDTVIHCGDVAFGKEALQICARLKGIKCLVMGNHDTQDILEYKKVFNKIRGVKYIGKDTAICTHIPIHKSSMRGFKINIHGHLHGNYIDEPEYLNVSVERIRYTPISLDEILAIKAK